MSANSTNVGHYAAFAMQLASGGRGGGDMGLPALPPVTIGQNTTSLPELLRLLDWIADNGAVDAGLRCGAEQRMIDLGIIGYAIASSRTLGQALRIWLTNASEGEAPVRLRSRIQQGVWQVEFLPVAGLRLLTRRFVLEERIASFFSFLRETTGIASPEVRIEFPHRPTIGLDYARWLPVTPVFQRPRCRLLFRAAILDSPMRSRDDEVLDLILGRLAIRPASERTFADKVARLLMIGEVEPRLAAVAAALGVSVRTLVRRLAAEDTSFGQLLDRHRSELAQTLVRERGMGAKEIARELGFRDHQSLRRAFTRWTGEPIGRWRRRQRHNMQDCDPIIRS